MAVELEKPKMYQCLGDFVFNTEIIHFREIL